MPVYVDDYMAEFRGMKMSHMIADTVHELDAMATMLGLKLRWKHNDHFDISMSKRDRAIQLGAIPITVRELAEKAHIMRLER